MHSLQRRAIAGGLIWAAAVLSAGTFALLSVFDSVALNRFENVLRDRHLQLVSALGNAERPEDVEAYLTDPAYDRPYSGRYWQINGPEEALITSRSLFDFVIALPHAQPPEFHYFASEGPRGVVSGARETITLADGSEWVVSVAETMKTLTAERSEIHRNLELYFGLVGVFMIFGAVVLTSIVLRPIRRLRKDVAARWDEGKTLEHSEYPAEVAPLVEDIETLLKRNRDIVDRGRRQAADLAHALKTPSAAIRNELHSLASQADMTDALGALDRIDAQIGRSLARMRAHNAANTTNVRTDLSASLTRLHRLFQMMADRDGYELSYEFDEGVTLPMDQQDLEEMLGNIVENAFKWCKSRVSLSARCDGTDAVIHIADDGPGIDGNLRHLALAPGARLDTAVPGTGLGLAITMDLANAYGGTLALEKSEDLGGLLVSILLPLKLNHTSQVNDNEP